MFIGVDLGSTNIKAAVYKENMECIGAESLSVSYIRENGFVEFDAEAYFEQLLLLLESLLRKTGIQNVRRITFTGQAESLVVLDREKRSLMNAISWMDERSVAECEVLSEQFSPEVCETVTGQLAVLPTWPATKILWLKRNRPEVYQNVYMLLKDYIVYRLTGVAVANMSIATFSFYFDIYNKNYWQDMLHAIGITEDHLPPLTEPCSVAGPVLPEIACRLGLKQDILVNIGTLDHFAGMIGTGNIRPGSITLSTGTVMALAAFADDAMGKHTGF